MRTTIENSSVKVKASASAPTEMPRALKPDRFAMHFQPQVDPRNGHIEAVEALMYWNHPVLGNIPPARFMPVAKSMGFADALAAWVIRKVVEQGRQYQASGAPSVRFSLKVAAEHLACPAYTFLIAQCLSDSDLDPATLELVVALSDATGNADKIMPSMGILKDLGVTLSLANIDGRDGALEQVRQFPVDRLKLDESVFPPMGLDAASIVHAGALIAASHRMGLTVTAEQVETRKQATLLTELNCDLVQGAYFSQTLPAEECMDLLRSGVLLRPGETSLRGWQRAVLPLGKAARYFGHTA